MSWATYMNAEFEKPGSSGAVVVLGHRFGCDSTCWHNLKPLLTRRGYGVLTYDFPYARTSGFGAFDRTPNRRSVFRAAFERFTAPPSSTLRPTRDRDFNFERYSNLDAYADDLIHLLDELGLRSSVFLGHSVSDMIGRLASTKRPNLFRVLILLSSSPRYINDAASGYAGGFEREQLRELFHNVEHNYDDWVTGFAPLAIEEPDDVAVRRFTTGLLAVRPDVALATCNTIFLMDLRHILPRVTVPCVILQSESDIAVPASVGAYMSAAIENSVHEILPTAGYLLHLSSPMLVNAVLLKHIDDTPNASVPDLPRTFHLKHRIRICLASIRSCADWTPS
jgi:pimeloyl-ACP methyl ester carboxylesterase